MPEELAVREQWFKIAVFSFAEYDKAMLEQFFDYWSEPNKSGKKMKFELEKTWDTCRRLKRWYLNDKNWNNGKQLNQTGNKPNYGQSAGAISLIERVKEQINQR